MANEKVCEGAQAPRNPKWGLLALLSCVGPIDAVRIIDFAGQTWECCELHGQAVLETADRARVEVGSVPGAAIRVYQAVSTRALRTRPRRGPKRYPA